METRDLAPTITSCHLVFDGWCASPSTAYTLASGGITTISSGCVSTATSWSGSDLEMSIEVPEDWEAIPTSPESSRGLNWPAHLDGLPADDWGSSLEAAPQDVVTANT